ncbi:MAG TPA: hypothetical protein PKC45_18005 [Gemmatales bacterium]|nr:hypothetical protein [Gemmatales bacterium]
MSSDRPDGADNTQPEQRWRRMRRIQFGMAIFTLCVGLTSFFSVAGKPRFETYHTLDVIRLITAGAAFGVCFVLLMIQFFNSPVFRSEDKKESEQGTS